MAFCLTKYHFPITAAVVIYSSMNPVVTMLRLHYLRKRRVGKREKAGRLGGGRHPYYDIERACQYIEHAARRTTIDEILTAQHKGILNHDTFAPSMVGFSLQLFYTNFLPASHLPI